MGINILKEFFFPIKKPKKIIYYSFNVACCTLSSSRLFGLDTMRMSPEPK